VNFANNSAETKIWLQLATTNLTTTIKRYNRGKYVIGSFSVVIKLKQGVCECESYNIIFCWSHIIKSMARIPFVSFLVLSHRFQLLLLGTMDAVSVIKQEQTPINV
jgi:hypothetical protein